LMSQEVWKKPTWRRREKWEYSLIFTGGGGKKKGESNYLYPPHQTRKKRKQKGEKELGISERRERNAHEWPSKRKRRKIPTERGL